MTARCNGPERVGRRPGSLAAVSPAAATGGCFVNPDAATAPIDGHTHLLRLASEAVKQGDLAAEQFCRMLTVEVGHTESTVVYEEHGLELHRYDPAERRHETPILLVYALVNRPYILDLQPDRSVIRRLLEAGFAVYLVDWGEPSRLDATLGLADYVCRYLDNCVDATLADAGAEDLHLLGYCMGGTMSLMYATRNQEPIRTLSCMATPVSLDGTGGILERWAEHFDPVQAADVLGNVPGELLAMEFAMMDPVDQFVTKYVRLYENFEDDDFVENFARMERWIWDSVDVAGRAFHEFVDGVYRDNHLARGEFSLDGDPVDLSAIEVPLCQIVGEYDHIVPPASSKPLGDLVGSDDQRLIEFSAGHIGISVSSSAHEELWPEVTDWLGERSAPLAQPPTTAEDGPGGSETTPVADDHEQARRTVDAVARRAAGKLATQRVSSVIRDVRTEGGDAAGNDGASADATAPGDASRDAGPSDDSTTGPQDVDHPEDADDRELAERTVDAVARRAAGKVATRRVETDVRGAGVEQSAGADRPRSADEPTARRGRTPVDALDGIGPTYAERLATAEIETVADLGQYSVPVLAAITDAPRGEVTDWLDQVS